MTPWPWTDDDSQAPAGGHAAARVMVEGDDDDVLTVAELLDRARIPPGDEESDTLLKSYITAARQQVERDTGCALPTQTIAVTYDRVNATAILVLPRPPLQEIAGITYVDSDGNATNLDPAVVIKQLDVISMPARLAWMAGAFDGLGTPAALAPLGLLCTVGWEKDKLPPLLKFAVGLLAAHYLTNGRDRVVIGTIVDDTPAGYDEAIHAYRLEVLT